MLKQENLYASQGEPVILSHMENEYDNGDVEPHYGARSKPYVNRAASMDTSLDTEVSWLTSTGQHRWIHLWIRECHGLWVSIQTPHWPAVSFLYLTLCLSTLRTSIDY
ncbi:hypothetical protein P3S67_006800 [Capsicum chacoense]